MCDSIKYIIIIRLAEVFRLILFLLIRDIIFFFNFTFSCQLEVIVFHLTQYTRIKYFVQGGILSISNSRANSQDVW